MALAKGYDVSDYQSSIPQDATFVIIKASEGAKTRQSGYKAKLATARSRGLVVGHYHFLHAEQDVAGEIANFVAAVGDVPVAELLVLDFEPYNQGVSASRATTVKNAWLAAVKKRFPNHKVGIYTNTDWWHQTDDNAGDFLWIADYAKPAGSPGIQAAWRIHQYTDKPLDTNVYNGSIADMRAWVGSATAPKPTAPSGGSAWSGLKLVPRSEWGARAYLTPGGATKYSAARRGVKVHYLGTPYSFGDHDGCAAYVRRLQASHMDGNGWSDIGYSFIVCEHGYVHEGRGLARRNSANGTTTLNEQHYAVCALLGSSGSTTPTPEQLHGLRDAIEYCQARGPAGGEIRGHRDGYSTDCPGGPLYAWVQAGAPRPNAGSVQGDEFDMANVDEVVAKVTDAVEQRLLRTPMLDTTFPLGEEPKYAPMGREGTRGAILAQLAAEAARDGVAALAEEFKAFVEQGPKPTPVTIDAPALVAAMKADPEFMQLLAKANADETHKRMES
ncbi:GH25 family lysozyme [Embleya sp. NPDC050154]|uniref:GH25 family lysozyme n=1 Tax=Embleya sp. NPDC050154 TaxID=3363988 RepID=UPI0037B3C3C0